MRNQKGITLIALVITIIVLLILAGVSIAMLTGENGILNKATSARSETNEAEAIERINLALNAVKAEIYDQQVDSQSWEPIVDDGDEIQQAIKDALELDGFGTTEDSDKYYYEFDSTNKVLVLTYYNTTTEVGTATDPIRGIINLDPSTSYRVTKANTDAVS